VVQREPGRTVLRRDPLSIRWTTVVSAQSVISRPA
jgi:hypothetical protein